MSERDHYAVLDVSVTATATQIKNAYRELGTIFIWPCSGILDAFFRVSAKKHHPDVKGGDEVREDHADTFYTDKYIPANAPLPWVV